MAPFSAPVDIYKATGGCKWNIVLVRLLRTPVLIVE